MSGVAVIKSNKIKYLRNSFRGKGVAAMCSHAFNRTWLLTGIQSMKAMKNLQKTDGCGCTGHDILDLSCNICKGVTKGPLIPALAQALAPVCI